MRTPLLAGLIAVLLPACLANEITGVGGEEEEEEMGSGSGSGSGSDTTTPRVAATVDKQTVTTELGKSETVTVNLESIAGFAGNVTIAASLVDAGEVPLPNVTMQGPPSVAITADGTATAPFVITVPMNATGSVLNGTLKLALTSEAGVENLTASVTVNNIYTIDYAAGTSNVVGSHMNTGSTPNLRVKRGAILRFHNSDDATHIIHGDDTIFAHEDRNLGGSPGRDYDLATIGIAPGTSSTLGCHTHGTGTYSMYAVE